MKKLTVLLFFVQTLAISAIPCWQRVEKAGWTYFSIPDSVFPQVDSIRYIVSQPFNPENPTVFFLDGSGNRPLLLYHDFEDGRTWNDVFLSSFGAGNYVEYYNFVLIAKPGTPICGLHTGELPLIDTAFGCIWTFLRFDFLNYYVEQLNQVVDDVRKRSNPDAPFFFIGSSRGGNVVATFAERHPEKVQRLVMKSAGILGWQEQRVFLFRRLMDRGEMSSEEAQERIDAAHEWYQFLKDYSTRFSLEDDFDPEKTSESREQHYNILSTASFTLNIVLYRLQNIDVPILVTFGTDDMMTRSNDFLPFFFTRWGKDNLTMMPILDANHQFLKTITNQETNEQEREFIGDAVFSRIMEWFSGDSY